MQQSIKDYPELTALLSGWFHQDFDIVGETLEEILGAFKASCLAEERRSLMLDISRFLKIGDDVIDKEFNRIFNPDIEPTGFATTTRTFLEEILRHLSNTG